MQSLMVDLFGANALIPHGYCLTWSPALLWLNILSDSFIVLSYYSIPLTLAYFVRKRKDLPYQSLFVLFGLFIVACGTTHLLSVITIWIPLYWLDGLIKAVTAVLSVTAAFLMFWVIPRALLLRSPAQLEVEVEERKKAQAALQESLDRLHKIASQVPGVVFQFRLRPDGSSCVPYASERIREIYRVSPEAVYDDASPLFSAVHPDDLPGLLASIDASAKDLAPWNYEYRLKFESEPDSWLLGNSIPQLEADGSVLWSGFITDIGERKKAEAELRIAATAFEAQEGMIVTDADGVILKVNHTFTKITGYTAEEAIGKNPRLLKSDRHDANFYSAIWESINRTGGWEGEIWNRRKSGEVYPEFITITAVKDPSSITTNYVATFNDITERKRADQKFATAYRKIQQLALRLDNVREEERVRIASELHDEMGATLTALKMRVHWLVTKLPAEMAQFVEEVEHIDLLLTDAVHTMRHVVSQLMPTLLHDLGFTAAVDRCVQDFQKLTGIECLISLPEEDLTLDDKQSSSMFRTLQESLNNIAKHSQASKVSILFIDRGRSLILLVKDNGVGFDKNTNKPNSFGLLCILERARMVNGKARISSKPGKGTQVVFSIPLVAK